MTTPRPRIEVAPLKPKAGHAVAFAAGETIHTESSYKYTIASFRELAARAGWQSVAAWTDAAGYFSVHALAAR